MYFSRNVKPKLIKNHLQSKCRCNCCYFLFIYLFLFCWCCFVFDCQIFLHTKNYQALKACFVFFFFYDSFPASSKIGQELKSTFMSGFHKLKDAPRPKMADIFKKKDRFDSWRTCVERADEVPKKPVSSKRSTAHARRQVSIHQRQ